VATANRSAYQIEIQCPDVASELRLERGIIHERLGTLFEMDLSLYSDDQIALADVIGKGLAVAVTTASEERFFHGVVTHFAYVGQTDRHAHYHAVLRPKLWLLGQSARCRVFKSMTAADILKQLLGDTIDLGGVASSPSVKFEHCVQYRETDLHFVSRLMERYGFYYFHQHSRSKHTLEIVSGLSGHRSVGKFAHAAKGGVSDEVQITDWRASSGLRANTYRVGGTKNLTRQPIDAQAKSRFKTGSSGQLEIDDFEATTEYPDAHLEALAKARMQALDATVEEFTGSSGSTKLAVGALFDLDGHPRGDQNRQYLITAATYQLEGEKADIQSAGQIPGAPFQVMFTAIDAKTPFSPPVVTSKPVVQGPHLATVTEETDQYGRVKVQFHWGDPDDGIESCWARVSQNWAGKEWGGVFLPHTGHEVIVEFLDGDPDQPIVTGRVYNKDSMPPLSLPGSKSQSIIRDHGGNEIVMEGADGAQTIRIHCPKHDSNITLGKSIEFTTASDWINDIAGLKSEKIKGKSTSEIGNDHHVSVAGDSEESIIGKCKFKVGADLLDTLMGAQHRWIFGLTSLFVGGMKRERILGAEVKKIGGFKVEQLNGINIKKGKSKSADSYIDGIKKYKDVLVWDAREFIAKARDTYKAEAKNIKEVCDDWHLESKKATHKVEETSINGRMIEVAMDDHVALEGKKILLNGVSSLAITSPKITINGVEILK